MYGIYSHTRVQVLIFSCMCMWNACADCGIDDAIALLMLSRPQAQLNLGAVTTVAGMFLSLWPWLWHRPRSICTDVNNMCMFLHGCVHVDVPARVRVFTQIHTYIHAYIHKVLYNPSVCICVCIYMYVCVCVCMCVHLYVCCNIHQFLRIHIYIYIYIYIWMYTEMYM
jgi:hypothetical protein